MPGAGKRAVPQGTAYFLSKSAMLRKPDGWGESDLGKNKQSQDDTCQQNTKD